MYLSSVKAYVAVLAAALLAITLVPTQAIAAPSTFISIADHDPIPPISFTGAINPGGIPSGQFYELTPNGEFLNKISGGATGNVPIFDVDGGRQGAIELVAVAIRVQEPGFSGSLSNEPNGAVDNVVSDLNSIPIFYQGTLATVYSFADIPQEYAGAAAMLSSGELAYGGQPFDILVVATFGSGPLLNPTLYWGFDLSSEAGGDALFTSISITDVGAIPEPGTIPLFLFVSVIFLYRPKRHSPARNN